MAGIFKRKYDPNDYFFLNFKTRIYPTKEQKIYFKNCFGIRRFAYNWFLDEVNNDCANGIKKQSYISMRTRFGNEIKNNKNLKFVNEVNNRVWQQALGDADKAYKMFYKGINDFPKKKKKKDEIQSFSTERCKILSDNIFKISKGNSPKNISNYEKDRKYSTKIKTAENIKFLENLNINRITVSFDNVNYYVSFSYRILKTDFYNIYKNKIRFYNPRQKVVGIDLGLKTYATQSDNKVAIFPKSKILKLEKRINRLNFIMSKKYNKNKKSWQQSKNYYKVKTKLNKLYKKRRFITKDFLDKYTTWLVINYKVIKIEDLKISNMMKNHKLAKAISRCNFFEFRSMLKHKCELYGSKLIVVDTFYPSSKICNSCGYKKHKLSLSERTYICENCGLVIDRDYNAALNISEWEFWK